MNLELYGKNGQIKAPGSRGLLVGPGTTRSIVLAGLAPGEERLSVHARSTGGPVSAFIQQSVLRGLTPGGVDFIAPGTAPSALQVMTGIDIQDAGGLEALTATRGFIDAAPSLQITVPGPVDAVVEVKLFGRGGQKALPGGGVVTAKAGTVTEVPLAGVPAGQYTVSASADVTIVAAARVSRGLKAGQSTDFAWAPSTAAGSAASTSFRCPVGGERFLVFGALEDRATISYTPITADGKVRRSATADIAGGTTTSLKVPDRDWEVACRRHIWCRRRAAPLTARCSWNGRAGTTSPPSRSPGRRRAGKSAGNAGLLGRGRGYQPGLRPAAPQ